MLTKIDKVDNIFIKRDDTFEVAGVCGGKARTCWHISQGSSGLVTAGSRTSSQVNIVAHIAKELGIPCRIHVPQGELSEELLQAKSTGATIIQHFPGYNTVISKRAFDDSISTGYKYIPFGMDIIDAINFTSAQVINVPNEVKRIVVPVGSGMSYLGIKLGMLKFNPTIQVVGVEVGANPKNRFKKYAPNITEHFLEKSKLPYSTPAQQTLLGNITLDPLYEAKCLEFLRPNDLLWIVGILNTHRKG